MWYTEEMRVSEHVAMADYHLRCTLCMATTCVTLATLTACFAVQGGSSTRTNDVPLLAAGAFIASVSLILATLCYYKTRMHYRAAAYRDEYAADIDCCGGCCAWSLHSTTEHGRLRIVA